MSAYLCSEYHLSALVTAMRDLGILGKLSPQDALNLLYSENTASLEARYDGAKAFGPFAFPSFRPRRNALKPLELLRACHGYSYQACEHEEWNTSAAHDLVEKLKAEICRVHKINDTLKRAPWQSETTRPVPAYMHLQEYQDASSGWAIDDDEAPPVKVPTIRELLALSDADQVETLKALQPEDREPLIIEMDRLSRPPPKGKISVDLPVDAFRDEGEEAHAEINPGVSITLWGKRNFYFPGKDRQTPKRASLQPYIRTFKVGDVVEESSYNLRYTGPITSIGKKTIGVRCHGNKRMSLERFNARNWNLDLNQIATSNAAWSD